MRLQFRSGIRVTKFLTQPKSKVNGVKSKTSPLMIRMVGLAGIAGMFLAHGVGIGSRIYTARLFSNELIRGLGGERAFSVSHAVGSPGYQVQSCTQLSCSKFPEYAARGIQSQLSSILWRTPLQNVYVVKKPWNREVRDAMVEFIDYIHGHYPAVNVVVSEDVADELVHESSGNSRRRGVLYTGLVGDIVSKTDLIVTLGGDGTILRAVSAFLNVGVPPVLSFAMGTLGFLLPFDFTTYRESFDMVYLSRASALQRTRLECHVHRRDGERDVTMTYAMNDVSLHRGSQPNLTSLDIVIDGEFLTTTTADGIVFATPTGSTAYSLSSGGSIAHPLVQCILLTPICPRSLSFRPLILPILSHIMIRMSELNRNANIKLNIDGIPQIDLRPGDEMHVVRERAHEDATVVLGIWCVARNENDWTRDINELLGFNSSFSSKTKRR